MRFQHILYAIPLLINSHKVCLYRLTQTIGYWSLVALSINSASAFESVDIKNIPLLQYPSGASDSCLDEPAIKTDCPSYIDFARAHAPQTFDYDPGLLPEVAKAIFALRVKHANIVEEYIINLSGNYLLNFTKEKIYIFDTYTKKIDIYEYQTTNPNITIGLGISKGLPRNYKSIIIKEDAHGQLYDYAALYSDNISTDETILSETLNHPFYEIAGQGGVENKVTINKAMAFYQVPSLLHHAQCVKSSVSVFTQLQDILASGDLVCKPKAGLDIFTASHEPVENMKLDQQLVLAAFNKEKYKFAIGQKLVLGLDLNGENAVALVASALYCDVLIPQMVNSRRKFSESTDIKQNTRLWSILSHHEFSFSCNQCPA